MSGTTKNDYVNIIQISAIGFEGGPDVFGLGTDGNVYYWNDKGEWQLNVA